MRSDPNAFGSFSFVAENPTLTYTLQYVSKYACPTNPQPSGTPPHPHDTHKTTKILSSFG